MPRTIICTTGTSIVGGRPYDGDQDGYRRQLRGRLDELLEQSPSESAFLQRASAETNSLVNLGAGADDEVVLLTTETPDGPICADEVRRLIEERLGASCRVLQVEGLQVTDSVRFRQVGVQKLFEALDRHAGEFPDPGREVLLNVTGGFKSVVPYVTLYGLLHQLQVVYLFERSQSLLRLPAVPLDFDYERLSVAMPALEMIEQDVVPRERFFAAIPGLAYERRDWYECLIEEDDGLVTPSAFGSLLLRQRQSQKAEVRVGPAARRQYEAATGVTKEQFTFMLERVADPLWRKGKVHGFHGTELTVFKPGNTSERMAAVIRDGRIYVCELLRHDEYERVLPGRKESDYNLTEFRPWSRPAEVSEPPSSEAAAFQSLWRRLEDALEAARRSDEAARRADTAHERTLEECEQLTARAAAAEDALRGAESTARSLSDERTTLLAEIDQLQVALADARRPWWRRWFG